MKITDVKVGETYAYAPYQSSKVDLDTDGLSPITVTAVEKRRVPIAGSYGGVTREQAVAVGTNRKRSTGERQEVVAAGRYIVGTWAEYHARQAELRARAVQREQWKAEAALRAEAAHERLLVLLGGEPEGVHVSAPSGWDPIPAQSIYTASIVTLIEQALAAHGIDPTTITQEG